MFQRLQSQNTAYLLGVYPKSDAVHSQPGILCFGIERQRLSQLILILTLGFVVACSEPVPDAQQLRQAIAAMEKAAEAKESGPILAYLADDFIANKSYRKANIRGMLLLRFRQNQHIHVYLRITELKITDNRAQLTCQVILAGRDEKLIPERGRVLLIHSSWRKRDGKWRVVRAQWRDPLFQP